jgi:hypothetical protein
MTPRPVAKVQSEYDVGTALPALDVKINSHTALYIPLVILYATIYRGASE